MQQSAPALMKYSSAEAQPLRTQTWRGVSSWASFILMSAPACKRVSEKQMGETSNIVANTHRRERGSSLGVL